MEELHLQPDEHILKSIRKHWLVYVGGAIPYAVFAYLPVLVVEMLGRFTVLSASPMGSVITYDNPWVLFVLGIWWLFVWMAAFSDFMRYYLDVWIITNKRIIVQGKPRLTRPT